MEYSKEFDLYMNSVYEKLNLDLINFLDKQRTDLQKSITKSNEEFLLFIEKEYQEIDNNKNLNDTLKEILKNNLNIQIENHLKMMENLVSDVNNHFMKTLDNETP